MTEVISIISPVFILIFIGFLFQKTKVVDRNFVLTSNKLIYYFCLPVLLFYKIYSTSIFDDLDLRTLSIMFVSILIINMLSLIVSYLFKLPAKTRNTFSFVTFRGNFTYVGLPVCYAAFGDKGLITASLLMAFTVPFINMLSVVMLNLGKGGRFDIIVFLKNSLINPIVLACITGLIFALLQIKPYGFVLNSMDMISNMTLPLALLCIGTIIDINQLAINHFLVLLTSIFKLLLLPLIAYVLVVLFGIEKEFNAKVLIILLASPCATINYVLAASLKGDIELAVSSIVVTTILSGVAFIFWFYLLGLN